MTVPDGPLFAGRVFAGLSLWQAPLTGGRAIPPAPGSHVGAEVVAACSGPGRAGLLQGRNVLE